MSRSRRPRVVAVLVMAAALAAFPLGALASHQFADVPDSNPFHGDISAIADAGVTSGCGSGNYCPSANVTREQMAAFMNRLGALAPGKTPVVNADRLDGLDSTQFVRSDVALTGHFNCGAADMRPVLTTNDYFGLSTGVGRMLTTGGYVSCNAVVPDGALVVGFRGTIYDNSASLMGHCDLRRFSITGSDTSLMAQTTTTGALATPGYSTGEDLSISDATIDNGAWTYTAQCYLAGASADLGVVAVSVEYEH